MDIKMWGSEITRRQLLETISRLQVLQRVIHEPEENNLKLSPEVNRGLTLQEEQQITSQLSFIAATTPSNLEVMAVCFEEDSQGNGATIRLASNAGISQIPRKYFETLAKILMTTASREHSKRRDVRILFQHVIRMDLAKILSRLGSRHDQFKKRNGPKPIVDHLSLLLKNMTPRMRPKLSTTDFQTFRNSINNLSVLYSQLEAIPGIHTDEAATYQLVESVIMQIYDISKSGSLTVILSDADIEPSAKSYILAASGKIGKYYSIAYELVSMARSKSYRIFKNIQISSTEVCKLPNLGGRIHAEIQLLFFYETNPDLSRPRVICSSKSACYLCNLFFELHGGFFMPRTHGRIYDRWLLPDWLELPKSRQRSFRTCLTRLKETLDEKIHEATTSPRRRLSDPKESVLLPSVCWPSSSAISNVSSDSHATDSTIRAIPRIVEETFHDGTSGLLTPPLTPTKPPIHQQSTFSTESLDTIIPIKTKKLQEIRHSPSSLSVCSIDVGMDQLPYSQKLTSAISALYLNLEGLFLSFEFTEIISGRLLVERDICTVSSSSSYSSQNSAIDVLEIPTTEELQMQLFNDATLVFHLEDTLNRHISIEIVIDDPS